ncbi:MAG: hypothetical protein OXI17_03975 [Gammaproteobacteria bacterium]|nr:hypothetical protein [Gammaproteobacteria bacterium]
MEPVSSRFFDPEHPLAGNRQRLDKVVDIMFRSIQKTLYTVSSGRSNEGNQLLEGGMVTANEILSEALADLLEYPPEQLTGTWEALAVTIARNKAVDALRASQKGLGETEHRSQLHLVSVDADRRGLGGETKPPLLEVLPGDWEDPEVEYERVEKTLVLFDLARKVLDEREQKIVFAILKGFTRKEVGRKFELTSQRVGQIFNDAMNRLATDPNNPFTSERMQEGGDQ